MGTVRQRAPGAQVAVTPDGKQIVTVDQTLVVRRFDAATGSLQGTHTLPSTPAYGIHLSASGKRLAALQWVAGGQNGTYRLDIWDLERAVRIQDLKTPEGFNQFEGIAFSPDEGQLGFTVNKQTVEEVRIWNLGDGKIRTLFRREEREASHYSDSIVRFSPDGKSVVARLQDRKLRCWEVSTDRLLWEGTNGYSSIFFFSPDSRHLIKYDGERVDAATGQDAPWPHKQPDWKQRDVALGMTPTGTHLVFRTHSSGLLFWDVATGTIAQQIRHPAERPDGPITTIQDLPHNFAFMPDGSGVAWRPGPVERWNVQTGKPVFAQTRADGHTEAVSRVLFSPDGRTLASLAGFNEGRVCVWDVTTSRPLQEFPTSISSHLAYGNNGHVFVLADGGARSH
jgi:WD40 repeat protein